MTGAGKKPVSQDRMAVPVLYLMVFIKSSTGFLNKRGYGFDEGTAREGLYL